MAADDSQRPPTNDDSAPVSLARLHSLVERVCDRLATAEELAELDILLTADRSARECYVRYISLHTSLQNGGGGLSQCTASECSDFAADLTTSGRGRLRWLYWNFAVAAMLAAVLIGVSVYRSGPTNTRLPESSEVVDDVRAIRDSTPVARVTQLSGNVLWRNPNESIALRSNVYAGQVFQISRGEILLTYDTGVELRLLAPAEFAVDTAGGNLRRGGLRAVVPGKGRGFTISTPNGKVVDLGTEFGVAVDDFGVSEVGVFQGMVDMFPLLDGAEANTIRLTQGQAVQWNSETLVRLKADPLRFGDRVTTPIDEAPEDARPAIDEDLQQQELSTVNWRTLGDVQTSEGSLVLRGPGDSGDLPYLITTREFAPMDGPITVVCDIRFTSFDPRHGASFAILTRSADERDADAPENWRTMHTCVRCSFKSLDRSSTGIVEAAMKLDRACPISNFQWRGFDRLEMGVPYRLVMTDDSINVTFTVSVRDDPSIRKTVTCRSLFRGKENFVVLEGPVAGTVTVDHIKVFQDTAASLAGGPSRASQDAPSKSATRESIARAFAAMAPSDADLIIEDGFESNTLDASKWTTLDDVEVIDGRLRLGKPNAQQHINTHTSRPYLLTRDSYAPADGALTILGTLEFETNFLNEYGGSFAVMTRADDRRGSGPGWEYSILRSGVRSNFWPAAWGQQHSLEVHEKPSSTILSLLVAEGLEINPNARQYFFKIVDDGETVTLTIQDIQNKAISKTVSVRTSDTLRRGLIGFEACWGCPVWLDNVRIYLNRRSQ